MFKLLPQDKANHEVYGARIAAGCACASLVVAQALHAGDWLLLIAAAAALAGATAAGVLKEQRDARANKAAEAAGEPPPHSVESADTTATVKGGAVVGVPLLVAWGTIRFAADLQALVPL